MRLPTFRLFQPDTLEEAWSLLAQYRGESSLLAGGTSLLIEIMQRLRRPSYIVSLKKVSGWDCITLKDDGGLRIGALASVEDLVNSPLVSAKYPVLAQAARSVSVRPLRQMSTVGGNLSLDTRCIYYNQSDLWRRARPPCLKLGGDICHVVEKGTRCIAVHQGDLAPALMALGARVKLVGGGGQRSLPLQDFFTGEGRKPNVLTDGEILAEVQVPPPSPKGGSAYEKLRVRGAMDFPLVSAAASVQMDGQGNIDGVRIVLGAVDASPIEIAAGANPLMGQKVNDGLEALLDQMAQQAFERAHPADNLAMDAAYRRKMTRVLVRRALTRAVASAQTG